MLARLLDEGEILVGKRQDRNLREVDLVVARQFEQQIERALEAADIDDQRLLLSPPLPRARRAAAPCAIRPGLVHVLRFGVTQVIHSSRACSDSQGWR